MNKASIIALALAGIILAGCGGGKSLPPLAMDQGCRIFDRPPYAVKGRTQYDQNVVDDYVESGVSGCGWQRPAARPPELLAAKALVSRPVAIAAPVQRKTFISQIKARVPLPMKRQDRLTAQPVQYAPIPARAVVEAPAPVVVPPAPAQVADPFADLAAPLADKPVIRRVY